MNHCSLPLPLRRALLLAAILAIPAFATAQGAKIGVLDMKQVTERSTAVRQLVAKAEAPLQAQKDKLEGMYRDYEEQARQLSAKRSALTEENARAEEQRLRDRRDQIEDAEKDLNRQYSRLDAEVMKPAVTRILEVVTRVAKAEGYDLVLPSEMALYHVEKIDITPLVIQTLDREGLGGISSSPGTASKGAPAAKSGDSGLKSDAKGAGK